MADDDGVLRSYVAKYVSKFSDSSQDEWLNDSAQGNAIAATVLCRYRPCEPEMALQMLGARFRQWFVSTEGRGKRDFEVPWPDKPRQPAEVEQYISAPWAAGHISLLDFLRKTNRSGQVVAWLKKLHKASGSAEPLESFAADFVVQGQQIVAAGTLSKFNDNFFGQWLLLHVPFRRLEDFYEPIEDKLALIPKEHRNFAMAVLCEHPVAREMWRDPDRFEAELRLEATTKSFVKTLLGMVAAHRSLVHKYLSGAADAAAEEAGREANQAAAFAAGPADHRFNRQQRRLQGRVDEAVVATRRPRPRSTRRRPSSGWRMLTGTARSSLAPAGQARARPPWPWRVCSGCSSSGATCSLPIPRTGRPAACEPSFRRSWSSTPTTPPLAWTRSPGGRRSAWRSTP